MTSAVLTEPLPPFSIPEPSLSTRAMLCSLSISMWSARKHDPEASEEIASRHGARPDAGRYHKVLLPKEALNEIQQIVSEARQEHYFVTLPWSDDGFRVLPAAAYFDHRAKMRVLADRFYPAVDSLVNRFTQLIEEARVRLGGLFREADYPHPEELRSRFAFETRVLPLPDAGDFRVTLGNEERERVKRQITATVEASLQLASRDLWQRLYDAVHHMAERLGKYKATEEGVEHPFRDTVVTNLVKLVEVLPKLNVTRDPELERLAAEVRCYLLVDPKELRTSESVRTETARTAAAIADRMATYMSAYAIPETSNGALV
jgi:hypothetical protein